MGMCHAKPSLSTLSAAQLEREAKEKNEVPRKRSSGGAPGLGLEGLYTIERLLGEGGTGETYLAKEVSTGELVAVKVVARPIPKPVIPMILHEIQIQGDLGEGHLNVINAREVILTHSHLALVMEYAAGGNLTNYVSSRWETVQERNGLYLTEDEARYFFQQFIGAVEYCHRHHVAHRDLKLDNTLLDDNQPPRIKICDFGFAKNWDLESNMYTQIGTPVYMSPQIIQHGNRHGYDGQKADVWASGVLLFVMLLGMFPFDHTEHPDPDTSAAKIEVWLQQVKTTWRENPRVQQVCKRLTEECRDLLDKMFELNEHKRIDIQGIKSHPWFLKPLPPDLNPALEQLVAEQSVIEKQLVAGEFRSKERNRELEVMMERASRKGAPGGDVQRVNLTKVTRPATRAKRLSEGEGDTDSNALADKSVPSAWRNENGLMGSKLQEVAV